jgi:hypothetical protein
MPAQMTLVFQCVMTVIGSHPDLLLVQLQHLAVEQPALFQLQVVIVR